MNLAIRGMAELDLFPSVERREQALREITAEPDRPKAMMIGAAIVVVVVFSVSVTVRWLLFDLLGVAKAVAIPVYAVVLATILLVSLRVMFRRVWEHELRQKLIAYGIPVCPRCGYALHGVPADTTRCSECGREFDERVRALIDAAPHPS